MHRRDFKSILGWLFLFAVLLFLCMPGRTAADPGKVKPAKTLATLQTASLPDTVYSGPRDPNHDHDGDPDDVDFQVPLWIWAGQWILGLGR